MDAAQKAGIVAIVGVTAIGIGVAVTGEDKPPPAPACAFSIAESGTFEQVDDSERCDLVFERPSMPARTCSMRPVVDSSIKYQWSYEVTPTGAIVRGLKRGERVSFECKEPT